ncbi:hypothetical protein GCM10027456_14070 [Kineosporia babensis]
MAASYFGVGGTLAGAAFGSVVSSVAGAFYTESLNKAHKTIQTTAAVVVTRYPNDLSQADNIRRMSGPAGVPVADSLNRVGAEDTRRLDVEHVEVPIADATQVMNGYDDSTQVMPPARGNGPGGPESFHLNEQTSQYRSGGLPPASRSQRKQAEQAEQIWWKKPSFMMAGISMAGFLIAMFFITGIEGTTGKTISGGEGTTLSKLVSNNTSSTGEDEDGSDEEESTSTPTESATPTDEATPTDSATPTATADEGTVPSESATPDANATTAPTATDSATDPSTGSDTQSTQQSTDAATEGDSTLQDDGSGTEGQMQEQVNP